MKELPLSLTINGVTYYSQHHLATTQTAWYDRGKKEGYEEGKKAYGYSVDDIKQLHTDYSHIHHLWFDKGYNTGKSESYDKGWNEGYDTASIKYFDEYSVKLEERYKSGYEAGYDDGYEQCKHDGISKINLNTESIEPTELSKEYDKGFTKGYEEGKHDGISAKEIPGEYLSRIEEARLMGYEEGRSDCREATLQKKLLQEHIMKYGRDEHGVIMEVGDDEEDGELIGPEQTEYAKGYDEGKAAGYEEGYERGFIDLRFLIKK